MPTAYEYVQNYSANFALHEWSDPTVLTFVDERVLVALDDLRDRFGRPIYPSQVDAGWARMTGSPTSQHYADGRLATAADIFPERPVLDCWLAAIADPRWGGFGLYLDTRAAPKQPGSMLHLDLREGPRVFWVRNEIGQYIYKTGDAYRFWELVSRVPKFRGKRQR